MGIQGIQVDTRVPGGYKGSTGIQGNQRDAVKQGNSEEPGFTEETRETGDTAEPRGYMRIQGRTRGIQKNQGDKTEPGEIKATGL